MRARFLRWCDHARWAPLFEWHFGLYYDQDGGAEGSGVIVRIEYPRWLRRWATGFLPPPPKSDRLDISDILLQSLVAPNYLGMITMPPNIPPQAVSWSEDALNR